MRLGKRMNNAQYRIEAESITQYYIGKLIWMVVDRERDRIIT